MDRELGEEFSVEFSVRGCMNCDGVEVLVREKIKFKRRLFEKYWCLIFGKIFEMKQYVFFAIVKTAF